MSAEPETEPKAQSPPPVAGRKRPRIDLSTSLGRRGGGKSMFGVVLGTLNKAKTSEEQARKTDAVKKRTEIDERLANKLKLETDHMRKGEEAKKERVSATRKEEELILRDAIYKQRLHRLPLLSNFLITTDDVKDPEIPVEDADMADPNTAVKQPPKGPKSDNILRSVQAPRQHPPPIYYLPKKLLPVQQRFIDRRKEEAQKAVQAEYDNWKIEKEKGIEEIDDLRKKSARTLDELKELDKDQENDGQGEDGADEDVDETGRSKKRRKTLPSAEEPEKKSEEEPMAVDEDKDKEKDRVEREEEGVDAVEY